MNHSRLPDSQAFSGLSYHGANGGMPQADFMSQSLGSHMDLRSLGPQTLNNPQTLAMHQNIGPQTLNLGLQGFGAQTMGMQDVVTQGLNTSGMSSSGRHMQEIPDVSSHAWNLPQMNGVSWPKSLVNDSKVWTSCVLTNSSSTVSADRLLQKDSCTFWTSQEHTETYLSFTRLTRDCKAFKTETSCSTWH